MSEGVFTNDLRVTFVEKSGSEVGDGTPFPLLITGASAKAKYDKLAEVLARVEDAKFSGTITALYGAGSVQIDLSFTSDDPPTDNYSGTDADCIVERAYAITGSPPTNATRESQIWTGPLASPTHPMPTIPNPAGSLAYWPSAGGLKTGLSHYAESFLVSSGYYPYGELIGIQFRAAVELGFSGLVAWVDTNSSGDPLDPLNELYLGLNFFAYTTDGEKLDGSGAGLSIYIVDAYTELTGNPNEGPTGDLTFVLSTGTLTCALYCSNYTFLTSATSSMTITATEWWPYAKNSPAVPVWNTATGAKL